MAVHLQEVSTFSFQGILPHEHLDFSTIDNFQGENYSTGFQPLSPIYNPQLLVQEELFPGITPLDDDLDLSLGLGEYLASDVDLSLELGEYLASDSSLVLISAEEEISPSLVVKDSPKEADNIELKELEQLSADVDRDNAIIEEVFTRVSATRILLAEIEARLRSAIDKDTEILEQTRIRVDTSHRRTVELNKRLFLKRGQRCLQCHDTCYSIHECEPGVHGGACKRCTRKGRECTPATFEGVRKYRTRRCLCCKRKKLRVAECRPALDGHSCTRCVERGIECRP